MSLLEEHRGSLNLWRRASRRIPYYSPAATATQRTLGSVSLRSTDLHITYTRFRRLQVRCRNIPHATSLCASRNTAAAAQVSRIARPDVVLVTLNSR